MAVRLCLPPVGEHNQHQQTITSTFIYQHLCTILHILDHILIKALNLECYVFFKEVFNMKAKHSVGTHSSPEFITHILYKHVFVNKLVRYSVQCCCLAFHSGLQHTESPPLFSTEKQYILNSHGMFLCSWLFFNTNKTFQYQ